MIKKNGDRELFDRSEIGEFYASFGRKNSLKSDREVDNIITAVEDSLYALGESEVTSKQIGGRESWTS